MKVLKMNSKRFRNKKWSNLPCIILFIFTFVLSCKNENKLPTNYEGFAILKTKRLAHDGMGLYTFILLPQIENEKDFGNQVPSQSITFLFTESKDFLEYKRQLNRKGWDTNENLILVKVTYQLLNSEWIDEVTTNTFSILLDGKEYPINDYAFDFPTDKNGENLYHLQHIELIKKIN